MSEIRKERSKRLLSTAPYWFTFLNKRLDTFFFFFLQNRHLELIKKRVSHDICLAGLLLPLRQNTFNCGQVRKVFNLTIWIQQASAYVVCLDLRGSP